MMGREDCVGSGQEWGADWVSWEGEGGGRLGLEVEGGVEVEVEVEGVVVDVEVVEGVSEEEGGKIKALED